MDQFHLPLFILNTLMILLDASIGYHMAPFLLSAIQDTEAADAGVRTTRNLLSAVVALYMFFNCLGFFQGRSAYLLAVSGLILIDLALQLYLRRKKRNRDLHIGDDEE